VATATVITIVPSRFRARRHPGFWGVGAVSTAAIAPATAGDCGLVDKSRSPRVTMQMVDLDGVRSSGGLLGEQFVGCRP